MLLEEYFSDKSELSLPIEGEDFIHQIERDFSFAHGFHFVVGFSGAFEDCRTVVWDLFGVLDFVPLDLFDDGLNEVDFGWCRSNVCQKQVR